MLSHVHPFHFSSLGAHAILMHASEHQRAHDGQRPHAILIHSCLYCGVHYGQSLSSALSAESSKTAQKQAAWRCGVMHQSFSDIKRHYELPPS